MRLLLRSTYVRPVQCSIARGNETMSLDCNSSVWRSISLEIVEAMAVILLA